MQFFWVLVSIIGSIYLIVDILVVIKRKNLHITRRSPWLLHISLWGNFLEVLSISSLVDFIIQTPDVNIFWSKLRDCGVILGHCAFIIPYILRAYRISIVFNLEKDWNKSGDIFERKIHRTRQIWLIKLFVMIMIIPLLLCVFILVYDPVRYFMPLTGSKSGLDEQLATAIYIFICFVEQLLLIFLTYYLKNIEDQYNMINELIWICAIWSISPIFSTFINIDRKAWYSACLLRNLLIFARSYLILLIFSFRPITFSASLTVDMLNSLEIILENEKTLEFFEKFLRNQTDANRKNSGYSLLCLYKEIECRIHSQNDLNLSYTEVEMTNYSMLNTLVNIDEHTTLENLQKSKLVVLKTLNEKYYKHFLKSDECLQLRKMIHKEEIIAFRVTQTSFLPIKPNKNKFDEIFIQ
ncbi:hypothetical protein SteCoe_28452 [Stentor coeruleus]|uniref:RGS domain-containing protein n=1 Tax=Stentor coeruleus TaxID=5963 RepID=A0A1R2B867_9CILI|nr:hypothetical protein SteCoe_28452 [Stentor coeruleus]